MLNWFKKDPKEEMKRELDQADSRLTQFKKVLSEIRIFCEKNNIVNELHFAEDYLKKMVELIKERRGLDNKLDELVKKALDVHKSFDEQSKLFHEELKKVHKNLEG